MEATLIERARGGDRAALEQLLAQIAPLVHRFGLRMCRHAADAEDVLQDTLLSVADHLPEYQGRSSLASWVFTLARTACARRRRGAKNQPHLPEEAIGRDPAALSPERTSPEQAASRQELRAALEQALGALSDEQREVLLLRDMEGLSAPEVADALGLSVEAVKSRLHRAGQLAYAAGERAGSGFAASPARLPRRDPGLFPQAGGGAGRRRLRGHGAAHRGLLGLCRGLLELAQRPVGLPRAELRGGATRSTGARQGGLARARRASPGAALNRAHPQRILSRGRWLLACKELDSWTSKLISQVESAWWHR
jgi:RNA polymerase sigma-70 factor (ECF subfamily)